jgi:hypothetical protein
VTRPEAAGAVTNAQEPPRLRRFFHEAFLSLDLFSASTTLEPAFARHLRPHQRSRRTHVAGDDRRNSRARARGRTHVHRAFLRCQPRTAAQIVLSLVAPLAGPRTHEVVVCRPSRSAQKVFDGRDHRCAPSRARKCPLPPGAERAGEDPGPAQLRPGHRSASKRGPSAPTPSSSQSADPLTPWAG